MFGQFLTAFERSLPLRFASKLGSTEMQEALLKESALKERLPGITHGIKQVIEYAAIAAIHSGREQITMPLLSSWRDMFEPLTERKLLHASRVRR
jgi:hypothetical protein